MTPLKVRPLAAAELAETVEWYEAQRVGLGLEFLDAVDAAFSHLRRQPDIGPEVRPRVRRVLLRRFPYGVFYTVRPELIEVLAVIHARRHPARWPRRA